MIGQKKDLMDLPEAERFAVLEKIINEVMDEKKKERETADSASAVKREASRQIALVAQKELREALKRPMEDGTIPKNRFHVKVKNDCYGNYEISIQSSVKKIYKSKDGVLSFLDGTKQRITLWELYTVPQIELMTSIIKNYAEGNSMSIARLFVDGLWR